MPLVAAQTYVASILQEMVPPGATGIRKPISALITPKDPDVNPDGVARCYVWPATGPEKRLAMPRNTGPGTPAAWKSIDHRLSVFLIWMDNPNDQNADVNFPLFIDYVMFILRTSPNEAQWQEAETGVISHFLNLGEDMSYDFVPPRTLEGQKFRRYDARVSCTLHEEFQR